VVTKNVALSRTGIARERGVGAHMAGSTAILSHRCSRWNKDFRGVARECAAPLSSRSVAQIETEKHARRTEENKMNISEYVGSVFLKADAVKASGPIRVRITDVSAGRFDKLDLTFDDKTRLSLNATNSRILARMYGMESNDWLGKEVELEVGKTQYRGELQESILIKPISPPIENKAPPKPEFDDAIDF
jgi:hypothetical protein